MPRVFARLDIGGTYVERIVEVEDIDKEWLPGFLSDHCVEITGKSPEPQIGWVLGVGRNLVPPPVVTPTPAERMVRALNGGCRITSQKWPAVNATYATAGPAYDNMRDELLYIAGLGTFSGGLDELDWTAQSGEEIVFATIDQFKDVARAVGDWITGWKRFAAGKADAPPADQVELP